MKSLWIVTIMTLVFSSSLSFADDEFDWELDFGIKKKSTIGDFPLQEIGADDLSDAAIGGALHTSTKGSGKPAYAEQNERDKKRKTTELEDSDIIASKDKNSITLQENNFVQRIEASLPQETVSSNVGGIVGYNHGTTYTNNNTAFERP